MVLSRTDTHRTPGTLPSPSHLAQPQSLPEPRPSFHQEDPSAHPCCRHPCYRSHRCHLDFCRNLQCVPPLMLPKPADQLLPSFCFPVPSKSLSWIEPKPRHCCQVSLGNEVSRLPASNIQGRATQNIHCNKLLNLSHSFLLHKRRARALCYIHFYKCLLYVGLQYAECWSRNCGYKNCLKVQSLLSYDFINTYLNR